MLSIPLLLQTKILSLYRSTVFSYVDNAGTSDLSFPVLPVINEFLAL